MSESNDAHCRWPETAAGSVAVACAAASGGQYDAHQSLWPLHDIVPPDAAAQATATRTSSCLRPATVSSIRFGHRRKRVATPGGKTIISEPSPSLDPVCLGHCAHCTTVDLYRWCLVLLLINCFPSGCGDPFSPVSESNDAHCRWPKTAAGSVAVACVAASGGQYDAHQSLWPLHDNLQPKCASSCLLKVLLLMGVIVA